MPAEEELPIKAIHRRTVPEEIIHRIKELIDDGYLSHGSRLPGERELARKLGVSRPSLREALRALSLLGVLEHRPGHGTFLSSSTAAWPTESFSILFSLKKGALLEVFEARKALEGATAALCAQRHSEEDLHVMQAALRQMRSNLEDPQSYDRHEIDFHMAVIEAAGNAVIADLMSKMYRLLADRRAGLARYKAKADRWHDYQLHEDIYERIRAGDPEGASRAMLNHLLSFEKRLRAEECGRPDGE
jgi:GntR family transcriptional repressor for pyruvate dehydrogenase complex